MISVMKTLARCVIASLTTLVQLPGQAVPSTYVPTMTFDVASVRQSPEANSYSVSGSFVEHSSSLTVTNYMLQSLVGMAYGDYEFYKVEGVPESMQRAFFTIQAKADGAADDKLAKLNNTEATMEQQHMMRALLADRFKLRTHWETREGTVYNLVAKNPAKLKAAKGEVTNAEVVKAWGDEGVPAIYQRGDSFKGFDFVAHGCTMEMLASELGGQFGGEVVDKTGLTGKYNFTLRYYKTWDRERGENETNPAAPLETAIQDQLGLKLEAGKGPVHILVIDHVEKPSQN